MHLITSASQDEELIYQITRTMWENRAEIAEQHPAGKALNPGNVARDTGIPYHPGAERFYKEQKIWPGAESEATTEEASAAESEEASDAEPATESEGETADETEAASADEPAGDNQQ